MLKSSKLRNASSDRNEKVKGISVAWSECCIVKEWKIEWLMLIKDTRIFARNQQVANHKNRKMVG